MLIKDSRYNFEKLKVWQLSIVFVGDIYKITKNFPRHETHVLSKQLRNCSISIASNIAEGAGRYHNKDFVRFLRIAISSVFECVTQLIIAKNEQFITPTDFEKLYEKSLRISQMINKLITSRTNSTNEVRSSNNRSSSVCQS